MRVNRASFRVYAAAVVVALSLATPAVAEPRLAGKLANIAIDNFGAVSDTYYRGAQPKGRDYRDLADLGVKTIINLTSDDADANEQAMVEAAGMKYVAIPMNTRREPTQAELTKFLAIVNDSASQPVYVHCVGGRHRTGVMTAVYRMMKDGWTADQAFKEMKSYKYGADFLHPEFKKFVYTFFGQKDRSPAAPVQATVVAAKATN